MMQAAPASLDCGWLLSVCVGAALLLYLAEGLLKQPKPEFLTLLADFKALAAACIDRFEAAGQTDAERASYACKTSNPAWAAVVQAGDREDGRAPCTLKIRRAWSTSLAE
jgi:hypothetical protein